MEQIFNRNHDLRLAHPDFPEPPTFQKDFNHSSIDTKIDLFKQIDQDLERDFEEIDQDLERAEDDLPGDLSVDTDDQISYQTKITWKDSEIDLKEVNVSREEYIGFLLMFTTLIYNYDLHVSLEDTTNGIRLDRKSQTDLQGIFPDFCQGKIRPKEATLKGLKPRINLKYGLCLAYRNKIRPGENYAYLVTFKTDALLRGANEACVLLNQTFTDQIYLISGKYLFLDSTGTGYDAPFPLHVKRDETLVDQVLDSMIAGLPEGKSLPKKTLKKISRPPVSPKIQAKTRLIQSPNIRKVTHMEPEINRSPILRKKR